METDFIINKMISLIFYYSEAQTYKLEEIHKRLVKVLEEIRIMKVIATKDVQKI